MDIGDPNEIPSTRKRLPSMQELGAFDIVSPAGAAPTAAREAPAAPEASATTAASAAAAAPGAPAAPAATATRPTPTPEQLRQALAKADPDTRQKLLRLISGGKSVQQVGSPVEAGGARRRSLLMQADTGSRRATPTSSAVPKAPLWSATSASASPSRQATRAARPGAEPPLMQIDANTELLDAAAPPLSPAERKAGLQAQLDQAQQNLLRPTADKAPAEGLAHKVLFPAYDPKHHGEDVHGSSRRRAEGPIEGHFPAPRQPFQARYQHTDGRPMTAEENKVEEVLQAQRCDETLSVLARDGVNGLLLSPRDLDAAVSQGLLSAETAATLWKTWAALRPVIHVIEEDAPEAATKDAAAIDFGVPDEADAPSPSPAPAIDIASGIPAPKPAMETAAAHTPPAAVPTQNTVDIPDPEPQTLPLPRGAVHDAAVPTPATGTSPAAPSIPPRSTPALRFKALARALGWAFVAYCVFASSTRLALLAWHQWGHLWTAR